MPVFPLRALLLPMVVLCPLALMSCASITPGEVAGLPSLVERDPGLVELDPGVQEPVFADGQAALLIPDSGPPIDGRAESEMLLYDPETGFPSYPLPDGNPPPLGPAVFASGFRDPLPRSPVWNPPGPKRVGLQAGHWNTSDLPHELRRLSPGASAGGWTEAEVNLLIARHAARFLEEAGVDVDILPTVIPIRYRAHAFVAIHADGDLSGRLSGYKIARPAISSIPEADDEFVRIMYEEYGAATGLRRDSDAHISRRMLYYYAFNTRRYQHAIDLGTPAQLIETGFLTNAEDRAFLTGRPDLAGRGIANGILRFLALELGRGER